MKKTLLFLLIALSFTGCSLFKKKTTQAPEDKKKPPINEPINVIDLSERPYVSLSPRNDGRELTLTIHTLPKPAEEMEYELEYQAGSLLQGAFGSVDLSKSLPIETKILLGSCSAGGSCSYHEDVKGGSLTLKFRADENYALKTEWRFVDLSQEDEALSSRDAKFSLDITDQVISSNYAIVAQTSGLPSPLDTQVTAGPYGLFFSQNESLKSANLTLRLTIDSDSVAIKSWDGQQWQSLDTSTSDKQAQAQINAGQVFVAAE